MQERQSQVNFRKLVRDLADMYQDHPFDVVISELVANCLDAKAENILIDWDDGSRVLVITDDGGGMDRAQFEEYHDFAAELKTRGDGIGFAGVGAKISFNIAHRVVTETRCDAFSGASDWRWHKDGSLRWREVASNQLLADGTRVEVHFDHDQVPQGINDEYFIAVLKRHYLPLLITDFIRAYSQATLYPASPTFIVNGTQIKKNDIATTADLNIRKDFPVRSESRTVGWGALGVSNRDHPVGMDRFGVLLCAYGKVIKAEMFGQSAGVLGAKLFGIVEIPDLIKYLTTNKSDLKAGAGRNRGMATLLDPVRDELKKFLADNGVAVVEQRRNQLTAKLEREMTKMMRRLPELRDFDGLLRKSQRLRRNQAGDVLSVEDKSNGSGRQDSIKNSNGTVNGSSGSSRKADPAGGTRAKRRRSRRNQGPNVAFEEHPDRAETAWLDSSTVVINSGHNAYRQRIDQDQARLTYCMFAIGIALDKTDLIQPGDGVSYVDKFISAWGQS